MLQLSIKIIITTTIATTFNSLEETFFGPKEDSAVKNWGERTIKQQ